MEQRYNQLRQELAGPHASAIEQMLAQHAALCWLNCSRIELLYANATGDRCTADLLATWERILTSAQARYLRAFESLARVQRLLHLPAVQVNIATKGGQQVNVTGSVQGAQ